MLVTGATGWVESVLVKDLVEAGHQVVGLVRSEATSRILSALGGEPLLGSLSDTDTLKQENSGTLYELPELIPVLRFAFGR